MYQSSDRKNFLDILLDPTAIAIVASLALHTLIGAGLPFFTQLEPDDQKVGPTTVKVVELTPSELQRIPQAPPAPTPQAVVPAPTPSVAPSPATPPPATKISTAPQTIPFSPLRPSDGTLFQPPKSKKQKAAPQKQSVSPLFDPNAIFSSPPKSQKPQSRKGAAATPSLSPPVTNKPPAKKPKKKPQSRTGATPTTSPSVTDRSPAKKPKNSVTPQSNGEIGEGGGNNPPVRTPAANNSNNRQAQQPSGTTSGTNTNPSSSTPTVPADPANTTGNSGGFYGKYTKAANIKLQDYLKKYPNLKAYPPKSITQQYPPGFACPKVKQPAFIVMMVAFGKLSQGQDPIIGETISPILENEKPYVDGDPATLANKKLLDTSMTAGFADATEVDKRRPAIDKDKPVLYSYRVQFTCNP
ncbi:hypothetical protein [Chamaesiphon sp. OTE_8_metabat_110]|uniref:hypothetical protein n=1 Tax=Chamaesiphon sp. OTE_8_metabat_110 TaxID=2964696 RepID=UPI00286A5124|nr:hypothetical protein [Chamaesiphon sp. OTE_8_metabat_110]